MAVATAEHAWRWHLVILTVGNGRKKSHAEGPAFWTSHGAQPMPASPRTTPLCRYHYDPLDRQMAYMPFQQEAVQRFLCKNRLATEIQGAEKTSIVQHDDLLLAQQQHVGGEIGITLLATDQQRSVLTAVDTVQPHSLAYTPYGHRPLQNSLPALLGFNGEQPDPVTGNYHLGNGYRQFNPVLMRFNSPDSWSPFGEGGLNAYAYCLGDPANRSDSSGHYSKSWALALSPARSRPLARPLSPPPDPAILQYPRLTSSSANSPPSSRRPSTSSTGPDESALRALGLRRRELDRNTDRARQMGYRAGTATGPNSEGGVEGFFAARGRTENGSLPTSPALGQPTLPAATPGLTSPQNQQQRATRPLPITHLIVELPSGHGGANRQRAPFDSNNRLTTPSSEASRLRNP